MSVRVAIPTQLRSLTGGAGEVESGTGTVADIVTDLEARHPGVQERLLDDSGALRRFVNVYVNNEDVRFMAGLDTDVPDGARVAIIPAVAGGAPGICAHFL